MDPNYVEFEQRKRDHIELALDAKHQSHEHNLFDDYQFTHEAIPNLDFSMVNIALENYASHWSKPFFISSMTAGHENAAIINRNLMAACQERSWAMGVGSQRRELTDKNAFMEWASIRKNYPDVFLMANLGLAQVITTPLSQLQSLVDVLQAQAFIIHCNPLQEVIQPEGTPNFFGAWDAIDNLVAHLHVPVVVKETGCGFSTQTIERLNQRGIYAIDISGMGGTHWGRIEGSRTRDHQLLKQVAKTYANWGVPTAKILAESRNMLLQSQLWASGGIRHGLDAAKAIAMGATRVGIAKPVLAAAIESTDAVLMVMDTYEYELKVAMFCTGCKNIKALTQTSLHKAF